MTELNVPSCPTHGSLPRSLHSENFEGIVTVISELIETVSGVGTSSYSRCPYGYPSNFEGVVRILEDLNTTISGISIGSVDPIGSGLVAGSGIFVSVSGGYGIIQSQITQVFPGSGVTPVPSGQGTIFDVDVIGLQGVSVVYSGTFITISGTKDQAVAVVSGLVGGEGITVLASGNTAVISTDLVGQGSVNFAYNGAGVGVISGQAQQLLLGGSGTSVRSSGDFQIVDAGVLAGPFADVSYSGSFITVDGSPIAAGSGTSVRSSGDYQIIDVGAIEGANTTIIYSGQFISFASTASAGAAVVTVSGEPGNDYIGGSLWFDTDQGRLFIYASGNGVGSPDWYLANADALAIKSEVPPSGAGLNAPPLDGTIWFNTLMGSLFVYDEATNGWYESAATRTPVYGDTAPVAAVDGTLWTDSTNNLIRVWDGSLWADVIASGNPPSPPASGLDNQAEGEVIGLIMGLS